MKKLLMVALVLIIGGTVFAGCRKKASPQASPAPTQKPRKSDVNVNQEPVENRPFVRLNPKDGGKAIDLAILEVKKTAQDLEYEIEYSAGALLQGAFGNIDSLASLPVKKEILLGSCSTGGKCTYNKDISGGVLTLRFGSPDYTLKSEWSYKENALKEKVFTSRDAKFTLDISKGKNTSNFVLVHQAPGYPGTVEGKVVAGPYMIAPVELMSGTASVSIRLPMDAEGGTIMAWDGKTWKEVKTTIKDRVAEGSGPVSEVYVVVAK